MMIIIVKTFFSLSCLRSSICIPFTGRRAICMSDWVFCMRSKATSSTLSLFCKTNSDFFFRLRRLSCVQEIIIIIIKQCLKKVRKYFFSASPYISFRPVTQKAQWRFLSQQASRLLFFKNKFSNFFVFSSFLSKVIQTRPTYFHLFFSRQKNNKKCFRKKLTEELNWTSACHSNFFWCKKEKKNFFQPATKKLQSKIISSE
jgi:hypothetical protein